MTKVTRTKCTACAEALIQHRQYCHECKGVGYIEYVERSKNCTESLPECPVSYDPMVHGWECSKCGRSGPCEPDEPSYEDQLVLMFAKNR
jgi:hypothetical protein